MDKLRIVSLNCRGLNNTFKRNRVFNFLKNKHANIYCLQDVHFTFEQIQRIKQEWGFNHCYINHFKSNARGTAILFNNTFNFSVDPNTIEYDEENGNYTALSVKIEEQKYTIVSLYGPNNDTTKTYDHIQTIIDKLQNKQVILCGDWNIIQCQQLDTYNYKHVNNPKCRNNVLNLMDTLDLKDPWREINPIIKRYTWRQPTPLKQARLDFFLISHNILHAVECCEIIPSILTDHSMITLTITLSNIQRGRGFWKFNNSLLHDKDYVKLVKSTIKATLDEYKDRNDDFSYDINDQLLLETLLLMIRGESIRYCSIKKKKLNADEEKLNKEVLDLEKDLDSTNSYNDKIALQHKIDNIKYELEEINKIHVQGVMVRSKAEWMEKGEKPSKFFLGLEARNFLKKSMTLIELADGSIIKDQKLIEKETTRFYKSLYTDRQCTQVDLNKVIANNSCPKLTSELSVTLEGKLTYSEILASLKKMKNGKSPGPDGFTSEFFKFFWLDLGKFIINSLNYAYTVGNLSVSQKQGLITCIPKGKKPKQFLKNWRPISLLNVTYKLASSAIANRIKTVLPHIINEDQKGFIEGRQIGEVTRLIYDIMEYTESVQKPGLLLLIDFEKAFDTVDRKFMKNVLEFFGFGQSIQKWIELLYKDIESSILVNGFSTTFFPISRGCRQGDPVSPYLFILCVEILGNMIRQDKNIKGIKMGAFEYLLAQFADDTTLMLDGTEKCLYSVLRVLELFERFSGLKVNADKTKLVWIGSKKRSRHKLCKEWKVDWSQTNFTLLGIEFDIDMHNITDLNYNKQLRKVEIEMNIWSARTLTPFGRNTVLKSLLLSKLNHLFSAIPNPSEAVTKSFQSKCFQFIWKGKPDKVKRSIMSLPPKYGGISAPKIDNIIQAHKISWIKKLFYSKKKWTQFVKHNIIVEQLWLVDSEYITSNIINRFSNPFWKDVFNAWSNYLKIVKGNKTEKIDILTQSIWHNDNVRVDNKTIMLASWFDKGIVFINDLINSNGEIYSIVELKNIYNLNTNYLTYYGVCAAVKAYIRSKGLDLCNTPNYNPIFPFNLKCLVECKSLCVNLLSPKFKRLKSHDQYEDILLKEYTDTQWENFHLMAQRCTDSIDLIWFQFRNIHNILTTNSWLYKIGYIESQLCSLCQIYPETVEHIYCECSYAINIWMKLTTWLELSIGRELNINNEHKLLGFKGKNNNPLNVIILLTKQYLYYQFRNGKIPVFNHLKCILSKYYNVTKYTAFTTCTYDKFYCFWSSFHTILE
jgi:exonuclease III